MSISEKITKDLKEAMIAKEELVVSVLRLIKAAMHNKVIEIKKEKLSEDEEIKVLKTEAKKRKDSIAAFRDGGREDLMTKEEQELVIIKKYLPSELDKGQISKIVQEVISSIDETQKNFGLVMKQVMAKTKGQADGKLVSSLVKKALEK
ncbi:GatB/YqeY domain-containing protein [Patescibacteria group bacterium]|nr:GatB/YqeY domain-containing protein [Patescibacteria group bacterium]